LPGPKRTEKYAAIFDLDGTFVDTAHDLAAAMNHALEEASLSPVDPDDVRSLVGSGARAMLKRGFELSAGRPAGEADLDVGLRAFLSYYADHIADFSRPFEGAVELVEKVRANGWATAICTNKREALAQRLLAALGLDRLFDVIVGADTTHAKKPNPAPVYLCMTATGATRGVFFGDSDTDVRAARAADLPCYLALFGYGPRMLADEAERVFESYAEAARFLSEDFGL
jgi:phosphoglycolate phosphatase